MKLRYKILNSILAVFVLLIGSVVIAIGYTEDCKPAAETASENTMKAVIYRCYGGPEVLEYVDVAKPTPLDDEVLVKVHAAGVNPLDWHYMRGAPYVMRLMSGIGAPNRQTMGVDFAGVVSLQLDDYGHLVWLGRLADPRLSPQERSDQCHLWRSGVQRDQCHGSACPWPCRCGLHQGRADRIVGVWC